MRLVFETQPHIGRQQPYEAPIAIQLGDNCLKPADWHPAQRCEPGRGTSEGLQGFLLLPRTYREATAGSSPERPGNDVSRCSPTSSGPLIAPRSKNACTDTRQLSGGTSWLVAASGMLKQLARQVAGLPLAFWRSRSRDNKPARRCIKVQARTTIKSSSRVAAGRGPSSALILAS
jgi:hypothetical protein